MEKQDISIFFQLLGEITRDLGAIEFLMRIAIARIEGDLNKFEEGNFMNEKIHKVYPKSFGGDYRYFSPVVDKFHENYPKILDKENSEVLKNLRNAIAHGMIAQIGDSKNEKIIKFKEINGELRLDYELELTLERLQAILLEINKIRVNIIVEIGDKK